jgi:hypothetical protein
MTQTSNSPDHILYAVREYQAGEESKAEWTKIGIGWNHQDGKGVSLKPTLPIDFLTLESQGFKLVLRNLESHADSSTTAASEDIA